MHISANIVALFWTVSFAFATMAYQLKIGNIRERAMIIGICLACLVAISTPYFLLAFRGLKKKTINLLASATGSIHNYTVNTAHIRNTKQSLKNMCSENYTVWKKLILNHKKVFSVLACVVNVAILAVGLLMVSN